MSVNPIDDFFADLGGEGDELLDDASLRPDIELSDTVHPDTKGALVESSISEGPVLPANEDSYAYDYQHDLRKTSISGSDSVNPDDDYYYSDLKLSQPLFDKLAGDFPFYMDTSKIPSREIQYGSYSYTYDAASTLRYLFENNLDMEKMAHNLRKMFPSQKRAPRIQLEYSETENFLGFVIARSVDELEHVNVDGRTAQRLKSLSVYRPSKLTIAEGSVKGGSSDVEFTIVHEKMHIDTFCSPQNYLIDEGMSHAAESVYSDAFGRSSDQVYGPLGYKIIEGDIGCNFGDFPMMDCVFFASIARQLGGIAFYDALGSSSNERLSGIDKLVSITQSFDKYVERYDAFGDRSEVVIAPSTREWLDKLLSEFPEFYTKLTNHPFFQKPTDGKKVFWVPSGNLKSDYAPWGDLYSFEMSVSSTYGLCRASRHTDLSLLNLDSHFDSVPALAKPVTISLKFVSSKGYAVQIDEDSALMEISPAQLYQRMADALEALPESLATEGELSIDILKHPFDLEVCDSEGTWHPLNDSKQFCLTEDEFLDAERQYESEQY